MNVLLDGRSLQTRAHAGVHARPRRLETLLTELEQLPSSSVRPLLDEELNGERLRETNVLVILTHEERFENAELAAIREYVNGGGGLLLMSNHGDRPGERGDLLDLTQHDKRLASEFGINVECSCFENLDERRLAKLSGSCLERTHPVIRGDAASGSVDSIVINNCCSLTSSEAIKLVNFSAEMVDRGGHKPLPREGRYFAQAREFGTGRVVVVADSGFVGSKGTSVPGPGLMDCGDNLRFVMNAIRWLGHELS